MHNLKNIRENPEFYKKKILDRNVKLDFNELFRLDKENREIIQKKEKLEQEKKLISRTKDKTKFEKSKVISQEINNLDKILKKTKSQIDSICDFIPNIALDEVPIGNDEKYNKELKKVGEVPKFNFKIKPHYELGENLKLIDFDTATKTSGSRFVFLKGKLALLERSLINFMLDIHTQKFGYQEISPPLIVNADTMFGTGQLPKFKNDQFELNFLFQQQK